MSDFWWWPVRRGRVVDSSCRPTSLGRFYAKIAAKSPPYLLTVPFGFPIVDRLRVEVHIAQQRVVVGNAYQDIIARIELFQFSNASDSFIMIMAETVCNAIERLCGTPFWMNVLDHVRSWTTPEPELGHWRRWNVLRERSVRCRPKHASMMAAITAHEDESLWRYSGEATDMADRVTWTVEEVE